jgi:predicted CXXCH cytochrome family protein
MAGKSFFVGDPVMNANMNAKTLKSAARLLFASTILVGVAGVVGSNPVWAGISATKHNLSSSGTGANHTTDVAEICVFCHTPHGSNQTAKAPLWNKAIDTSKVYTVYSSTTFDAANTSEGVKFTDSGTVGGVATTLGTVSMACLSCHDGTQAMDTVLNAPGSGGYNATGARIGTFASGGSVDTSTGMMTSASVAMLGTDLSNDHPVGMLYANQPGTTVYDADFHVAAQVSGKNLFYVESGVGNNSSRDKYDLILYSRSDGKGYVECATCHDPHSDTNATFLRITNSGSKVCLTCHNK